MTALTRRRRERLATVIVDDYTLTPDQTMDRVRALRSVDEGDELPSGDLPDEDKATSVELVAIMLDYYGI